MYNFKSFHIQTKVHGSYLIQKSKDKKSSPLLVGFHGYGETAEDQLQLLQNIPGIENWIVCSIQALHSFYNTRGEIGYSWMTSENREQRFQENVNYVNSVIQELQSKYPINDTLVYHGFSQGTAMACRAAVLSEYNAAGVILLGGDIPPELSTFDEMHRVLLARGKKDKFYPLIRWKNDIERVQNSKSELIICEFNAGHGGHGDYYQMAGRFLKYYI